LIKIVAKCPRRGSDAAPLLRFGVNIPPLEDGSPL